MKHKSLHTTIAAILAGWLVAVAAVTPAAAQNIDFEVSPELYGPDEWWWEGAGSGYGDGRWWYTYSSDDGKLANYVIWRGPYLAHQFDGTSGRLIRKYPTVSISMRIPQYGTRADNGSARPPGATVAYSVYCPSEPSGNPTKALEVLGMVTIDQDDYVNVSNHGYLGTWKVPSACDRVFIYTSDSEVFSQHDSNLFDDRRIAVAHARIGVTYDLALPNTFTAEDWAQEGLAANWNCIVESYRAIEAAAIKTDEQVQDKGLWGNIIGVALSIFPSAGVGWGLASAAAAKFAQGNTHEALAQAFWALNHVCLRANPKPLTG